MAHTATTAELTEDWDLQLTAEGNIKLCGGALALAQDCANEIRLWTNDAYLQAGNGIAWKEVQIARKISPAATKGVVREACMRVDGVREVLEVELDPVDDERVLHGQITVSTENGNGTVDF